MAKVLHHKVVVALPLPLEPDSIYYVRKGEGLTSMSLMALEL